MNMCKLPYPSMSTREEKIEIAKDIRNRLLKNHRNKVLAIGIYGSIALGKDGPYSDIEMHVITKDGTYIKNQEFIYSKYKIEINVKEKSEIIQQASGVDDSWAIKTVAFTHILSLYDPGDLFKEIKSLPFQVTND
ncbi:nucleotidyltransferase domain-containing protein [Bacillus sp. 1P06AnD]|uniref:nucleotidyltransferase domain-containing protein n=1 Tax=Bacillus sp. 1P06AnD TaxID=3132208 RepID=UPI0039A0697D